MSSRARAMGAAALWTALPAMEGHGMEIIAHRGAMRLAPENTLASQRLAYELGADVVECDVRLSSDRVPVIMHDRELLRTTGQPGVIPGTTLQELKQLDAGSWVGAQWAGERIPTLAEMLEVATQYNRKLILDIKGEGFAPYVVPVILQSGIPLNQVYLITYWDAMTTEYVSRLPGVKMLRNPAFVSTGAAIPPKDISTADIAAMRQQKVTTLFLFGAVAAMDIMRFHAAGFEVSILYQPQTASFYYQDIGADQFWTDFTDITMTGHRRMSQEWANWAASTGLAADQRQTWQDADGDGLNQLTEYALGTNPLSPDSPLATGSGFGGGTPGTVLAAENSIKWTLDLRENWSQFVAVKGQSSDGKSAWTDTPPSCCTALTPARLQFQFPITTGRRFFRLRFDVQQ